MNKKLIRLTEADLHRIVRESVNKVLNEAQLNELAPRTYASAMRKANERGEGERAHKFGAAAAKEWGKRYGVNRDYEDDKKGFHHRFSQVGCSPHYNEFMVSGREHFMDDSDEAKQRRVNADFNPFDEQPRKEDWYRNDWNYDPKNDKSNVFHSDPSGRTDRHRKGVDKFIRNEVGDEGINVLKQMQHGNGKYVKGKGWQ